MNLRTLVLNSFEWPHRIVSWQRGVVLAYKEKVDVLRVYETSIPTERALIAIPAVVRLRRVVPMTRGKIKFNRMNVYLRDSFRCCYCGKRFASSTLTRDHVIPRSQWTGPADKMTDWGNIVTACVTCNLRKGRRTPEQAGMPMLFKPHRPRTLPVQPPLLLPADAPEIWRDWQPEEAA